MNRDLMEKVLDRAESDPEWKQRLLDDPEAAIAEADFPEARELQRMRASVEAGEEAEVTGQIIDNPHLNPIFLARTCQPHPASWT